MNQTFTSGISFFAATIAVFGVLYLVDLSFGSKPSANPHQVQEIKGSVGAISPVEREQSAAGARPAGASAATGAHTAPPLKAGKKDQSTGSR
jgi:hypothetical protein